MVIAWSTKKTNSGYKFTVMTVEYEKASTILNTGILPTRVRAATMAKKWTKYHRTMAKKVA